MKGKKSEFSVCDQEREAIRKIPVAQLEPAEEAQEQSAGISGALMPDGGPMSEGEFAEFWAMGLWDMIAQAGDLPIVDRDLSPVMVGPDRQDRALKAGHALYKLSDKYPKALGWMRSPIVAATGEMGACAMFFGSQILLLGHCMGQPRRSAGQAEQETADA